MPVIYFNDMPTESESSENPNTMERRRLQNREAQRRYRENIKRKLRTAEAQMRNGHFSRGLSTTKLVDLSNEKSDARVIATDASVGDNSGELMEINSPTFDLGTGLIHIYMEGHY